MKNYIKPNLDLNNISVNENIAVSLNEWLMTTGLSEYEQSITTHEYHS